MVHISRKATIQHYSQKQGCNDTPSTSNQTSKWTTTNHYLAFKINLAYP